MENFNEIINFLIRTIGSIGLGYGIGKVFYKDYKIASWILSIVSILLMIGYCVEKYS